MTFSQCKTRSSLQSSNLFYCLWFNVHPFVALLSNLWTQYFEKDSTDFDASWHNWSTGQGHETVSFRGQEVKGQGHTRLKYVMKISFGETSQELSEKLQTLQVRTTVNARCVKTIKMLKVKGHTSIKPGRGISLDCPPPPTGRVDDFTAKHSWSMQHKVGSLQQ